MKAYIHKENDKLVTSLRDGAPSDLICECPKKEDGSYETDLSVIDIVDKLDEFTEEVIGKEAVINEDKVAQRSADLQAKEDAKAAIAYKMKRRAEYPPIGDQLDALYKKLHLGDSTEYDALSAEIAAVKEKYPKPE